ncbi:MAG: S16 family serine protease [Nanoarchaeota archaeon]
MRRLFAVALMLMLMLHITAEPVEAYLERYITFDDFIQPSSSKEVALLAVQETPQGYRGSMANVKLELREGSGRVFLDTFPLSKVDTQISTRFAKEIACKYIENDCPKNDFIYTIRSDSSIIGGPSAGAAISIVTIALLRNFDLDPEVAITGTINSGGIIGTVSGLKYKIDAAAQNGITKVLIPLGSAIEDLESGQTFSAEEYEEISGIEIVEVSDLNDVIYEFTGRHLFAKDASIEIPDKYITTMRQVATELCNRSDKLYQVMKDQFEIADYDDDMEKLSRNLEDGAINLTAQAESAIEQEHYYSAASYCYGANIKYNNIILLQRNQEGEKLEEVIEHTDDEIAEFESYVDSIELNTLSDFEVYIIMKERIETSKEFLANARKLFAEEDPFGSYYNLAYAIERLHTSKVWSEFLGLEGKMFMIDNEVMRDSCMQKLAETQERIQYIAMFLPQQSMAEIQNDLNAAYADYDKEEYALCISKASRAKASANVLLSVLKSGPDNVAGILARKLEATKSVIVKEQEKNIFPIMGYSYYEYATSMQNTDPISSLVYAEYALELSWLDIYFSEQDITPKIRFNPSYLVLLAIGFILGCIFMVISFPRESRHLRKRRTTSRRSRRRKR